MLLVVSGPSGVGKGTLCARLIAENANARASVSMTTRAPMEHEAEGRDYFFRDEATFERMVREGGFLEHAYVHGNRYGTPRKYVEDMVESGNDVVLEIDVQGSVQAMKAYPDAVTVFILPPSRAALRSRLASRNTETDEQIELRLRNAELELFMVKEYRYCIVNDVLSDALDQLKAVIAAERCLVSRGAALEIE